MGILEGARALAESGPVYDAYLGRAFTECSFGLISVERGKSLRIVAALDDNEPYEVAGTEDYWVCEGACAEFDDWAERYAEATKDVEIETYQVDTRAPPLIEENELLLREGAGLPKDAGELSKPKFNREVGERMGRLTGTEVDFTRPDVQFLLDTETGTVGAQLNSTFAYGHYRELARDILQTGQPYHGYGGSGYKGKEPCNYCGGPGYLYEDNVGGFVAPAMTGVMDGIDTKFRGVGHEDVDAFMLDTGRPFVVEIMKPCRRTVDVEQLEDDINAMANNEIEVEGPRLAICDMVERVKKLDANKKYHAAVEFDDDVTNTELAAALGELTGATIEQYTPNHVDHRRTSITRTRHVHDATGDLEDPRHAIVETHGEGDLYIGELVSGDEGRTNPSPADILDTGMVVTTLDVIAVEDEDKPFEDDASFRS